MHAPAAPTTREPFWPRFLLALGLGHLAGAYTFVVATMLLGALSDLSTYGLAAVIPGSWARLGEGIVAFPFVTLLIGLWAALMMVPFTLLATPFAWMAARWLRAGLPATMALGALTGLLPAYVMSWNAPKLDLFPFASAAATGAVFAAVIWRLCIRLRLSFLTGV